MKNLKQKKKLCNFSFFFSISIEEQKKKKFSLQKKIFYRKNFFQKHFSLLFRWRVQIWMRPSIPLMRQRKIRMKKLMDQEKID
jgi:hypothetical protein